jgi:molecular chaperone GrpE
MQDIIDNKQDILDNKDVENQDTLELESAHDQSEQIIHLQNQIEELKDKLLRAMAESENTRRRFEKMVAESRDYAITSFAKDLLSVMDNLSRSLQYNNAEITTQIANVIDGVKMTRDEMESIFTKHGLEKIDPAIGDNFDYNLHHAVSQVETNDYDTDKIVETMQQGYKIKERLLRPAIVKVAKKISE